MMNKKLLVIGCFLGMLLGISNFTFAQDVQFSQFYASPLYTNPGYTGATLEHRFVANYRLLWPGLPNSFSTYAISYDYNLTTLNSGVGIIAMTNKQGTVSLRATSVMLSYAYKVKIAGGKWLLSPGIQFGVQSRSLDREKLLFGDQVSLGTTQLQSYDPSLGELKNPTFLDLTAGFVIYNKTYWVGVAAMHLNSPDISFIGQESLLSVKYHVHGGLRIPLVKGVAYGVSPNISSIAPSFIFKSQGTFTQLDVGTHFHYDPIMAGVWYRGIPISNLAGNISQEAVIILFGLKFSQIDIGYSYDFTISELGASAGGGHEISLKYILYNTRASKPKAKKYLPCPTY